MNNKINPNRVILSTLLGSIFMLDHHNPIDHRNPIFNTDGLLYKNYNSFVLFMLSSLLLYINLNMYRRCVTINTTW